MYYNSLDQFLTPRTADLTAIMEGVQTQIGGHYATMIAEQRHTNAINDTQYVITVWRSASIDREQPHAIAAQADQAGVDVDDLKRLVDTVHPLFVAFVQRELAAQPELAAEIIRRMHHSSSNYRSRVTEVKLDKALRRIRKL